MNATRPRYDIYRQIHKALRIHLATTHARVGRMDCDDADDMHATLHAVEDLLAACRSHLAHEDTFVHAAIEARAPAASRRTAEEHRHHDDAIVRLSQACVAIARADGAQRQVLADRLYDELGEFIADNLAHMRLEETVNNTMLWAHYSDAELFAIEQALVASIPPQELLPTLAGIVAAVPPHERVLLLDGIRGSAPLPVFEALLDAALRALAAADQAKLLQGLRIERPHAAPLAA